MGAEEHGRINPWSKKYGSAHGNQGDGHHHAYYDHAHHLEQASQEGFLTSCFPLFPSIFGRKKKNKKGGKSKTDFASPSSSSSSSPSTAGAASPSNTMPDPSSPFRTVASNANSPQATDDHNNITTIPSSWKNKLNPGSPFDRTSMTVSPNKSTEDNSSLPVMSGMDLIDIYQDRSNLIKAQSISNIIEDEQSAVDNVMRTSPINLPREEGEKNYTSNVKSGKRQKGNKSKKNQVNDSSNKVTSTSPASVITSHTDDDLHNSPSRFRDDAIPFPADIRTTLRTSLPKLDGESYPGDLPMSSSLLQCNSNSPGREKSSIVLSNEMATEMMLMSAAEGRHQDEEEEDELRRSPQDLDGYNNHTNNSSRKSPRDKSSSKKKSNKSNKVKGSNAYFEGGTSNGLPAVQETPRSNLDHIPHCEASIYALRQQQDDQSNTTPTPSSNPFSSQWNSGTNHDGRPMGNAPRPSSASSTSSTESQSKCTIM